MKYAAYDLENIERLLKSVVAQWCNRLTLQPEQSGGVGGFDTR